MTALKEFTYKPGTFPKRCSCGALYSEAAWKAIPHYGVQEGTLDGKRFGDDLDMRTCSCQSTMSVPIVNA